MGVIEIASAHPDPAYDGGKPRTSPSLVLQTEFLPLPGCFPAVACGPGGEIDMAAVRQRFLASAAQRGPQALGDAHRFLDSNGEFDYMVYNYFFMCTINKELAIKGLHQRMQEMACPSGRPAATAAAATAAAAATESEAQAHTPR